MQKLDLVFVSEGRGVHLSELRGPRAGCSDGCYFCLLEKGHFSALQEELDLQIRASPMDLSQPEGDSRCN